MINLPEAIQEMLSYKESLGFSRKTYESYLRDFNKYFSHGGHNDFTAETVLPWCEKRDTETPEGFRRRVTPLRELSKYMYAMGYTDYIVPTSIFPITRRTVPYIFTDGELRRLFAESDKEPYCKTNPCRHLIIPVIYRLIYFCGLRPNEGRELKRSDFCYEDKTLYIRKNKSHRERLIPVSAGVADMCQQYLEKSRAAFPDTEYMFPSPTGEPYQKRWLADTFRRLWDASKPEGNSTKVRVYLLRHRYATAMFMKWLDEKADLNAMLPYLSAYMGHSNFSDTAYYIHLMPENLLASAAVDWEKLDALNLFIDYINASQGTPLADISFKCISRELVESFLMWLETDRGYSVNSRNQRMCAVKSFLRYAAEKDKILMPLFLDVKVIPKKKDTRVREIEFFSESALKAILEQPDRNKKNGQRDLFFMILMYDTGARAQEILDLRLCNIRMDGNNPYVVITGKGAKTRNVPIMEKTCKHLKSYLHKFHTEDNPEEYLFYIDRKGIRSQMSIDNVEKFVARYGKKAQETSTDVPEHLYPHMWRHSRAMHLYRNGMPLPLVAEWLGHAKMDTTRRFYANADTTMKKEAIEKATSDLNPLFSNEYDIDWEDDEDLLKKLYGLK